MKLVKKETDKKGFEPFEITLKVESEEEARLLYHVFNRGMLSVCLYRDDYDNKGKYDRCIANEFSDRDGAIRDFIKSKCKV